MTRILVISDTHCRRWEEVHPGIRRAAEEADLVVHCGDYTRPEVVRGLTSGVKRAVAVHGNSDPPELRKVLPYKDVIEVEGKRIGVIHPAWGGQPFKPEQLLQDFDGPLDAILFGHLHETYNQVHDGVLFLNPGQGYASFRVSATVALLTVDGLGMRGEIRVVEPGQ